MVWVQGGVRSAAGEETSSWATESMVSISTRRGPGNTPIPLCPSTALLEPRLPSLTLCLGVLSAILLLAAVVIGVYCVKARKGLSNQHPNASAIYTELKQLQANYRVVLTDQEVDRRELNAKQSACELLKQQIQLQHTAHKGLESQIADLQTEMRRLQSNISDNYRNCGRCLPGWDLQGSSCYFYSGSLPKLSWGDSREDCISRGGDLVVIESWEEQQLLFDFLPRVPPTREPWWTLPACIFIGLRDTGSEGSWVWVNNVTFNDEGYWIDGEPNDFGQNEDCAGIFNRGSPSNTCYTRDGHSQVSNLFGQGSKSKEGYLQPLQNSEHVHHILELNYLRQNHSNVIKATVEAEKTLKLEAGKNEGIKQQLEKQKGFNDGLQSQIETVRAEKTKLADKLNWGEMELENLVNDTFVSADVGVFDLFSLCFPCFYSLCLIKTGKSCGRCPEGWVLLNTTCYFFSNFLTDMTKKNWIDSRTDCLQRKADLVVIDSWEEQLLLNDNLPRFKASFWWSNGFWIGMTEISEDNTWVWINNVTQTSPFYWLRGEPTKLDENCAAFYPAADATQTWYDGRCHGHELYWICVKARKGLSNQHPNASAIYTELKQLQANYRVVLTDQEVDRRELNAKQGACELLKQQIQLQHTAHKGLESQIADLQTEMRRLLSNISDNCEETFHHCFQPIMCNLPHRNCGRCLPGWDLQGSSCYFYSGSLPKLSWGDSREDCISRGGDLVVIESWEEQPNDFGQNEDCAGIFNRGSPSNTCYTRDGHSQVSNLFGQVYRSRFVIPILGLLNIVLLVTAVVLGIYCSKSKEGYLQPLQNSEHVHHILELNYLRQNHSDVIKATVEAEKTLKLEAGKNEGIKQQLEKQKGFNDGLQSQIETVRAEKTKLLADKLNWGEMELENLVNDTFVSADVGKSCGRCPEGWVLLNTTCYFFSNFLTDMTKKNWIDSRTDCLQRKADLVVIDSWEEQLLLNDNLPRFKASVWWSNGFWIGMTEISEDNTWVWINNVTQTSPFYWVTGEPNRSDENCAAFYPAADATQTWYDGRCHGHEFYWICEMKQKQQ
ncbi:C-type lectin domain family 4 member M [Merluccius polli]|uniref:C-type lectin domain family 4 member M n=1 Tax=Merluccius polli TaxID=89951 RepID=A0AA47LZ69_MERPO|nr:C-type lectin domain family 4 member M [Merluccius polli]